MGFKVPRQNFCNQYFLKTRRDAIIYVKRPPTRAKGLPFTLAKPPPLYTDFILTFNPIQLIHTNKHLIIIANANLPEIPTNLSPKIFAAKFL